MIQSSAQHICWPNLETVQSCTHQSLWQQTVELTPQTHNGHKRSFNFDETEYPELPKKTNQQQKTLTQQKTKPTETNPKPAAHPPLNGKELREQIMADMQNDLTKMISKEITTICTKLKDQLTDLSTTLKKDMNDQINDVLQTIAALNQRFNKVMECLPPNTTPTPAHRKSKELGVVN